MQILSVRNASLQALATFAGLAGSILGQSDFQVSVHDVVGGSVSLTHTVQAGDPAYLINGGGNHLSISVQPGPDEIAFLFLAATVDGGFSNAHAAVNPTAVTNTWSVQEFEAAVSGSWSLDPAQDPDVDVAIDPNRIGAFSDWLAQQPGPLSAFATPNPVGPVSTSASVVDERKAWSDAVWDLSDPNLPLLEIESAYYTAAATAANQFPSADPNGVAATASFIQLDPDAELTFQVVYYNTNTEEVRIRRRIKLRRNTANPKDEPEDKDLTPYLSFPHPWVVEAHVVVRKKLMQIRFPAQVEGLRAVFLVPGVYLAEVEQEVEPPSVFATFRAPEDLHEDIGIVYFLDSEDNLVAPVNAWGGGAAAFLWQ